MSDADRESLQGWADQELPAYPLTWRHFARDVARTLLRMSMPLYVMKEGGCAEEDLAELVKAQLGGFIEVPHRCDTVFYGPGACNPTSKPLSVMGVSIIPNDAVPEGEAWALKHGVLANQVKWDEPAGEE
jgi:hypothetical protein